MRRDSTSGARFGCGSPSVDDSRLYRSMAIIPSTPYSTNMPPSVWLNETRLPDPRRAGQRGGGDGTDLKAIEAEAQEIDRQQHADKTVAERAHAARRHQDCRIWSCLRRQPPQTHRPWLPRKGLVNERRYARHRRPKCLDRIGRRTRSEDGITCRGVKQMQSRGVEAERDLGVELDGLHPAHAGGDIAH